MPRRSVRSVNFRLPGSMQAIPASATVPLAVYEVEVRQPSLARRHWAIVGPWAEVVCYSEAADRDAGTASQVLSPAWSG
jgi:hypothetical protein